MDNFTIPLNDAPIWGRVLVGFYFVFFGGWNIYHWRPTLDAMLQKKIGFANVLLTLGIAWQSVLGLCLILGIFVKLAAILLIPFNLLVTLMFHPFWCFEGEIRRLNMLVFIANLTVTWGALLLLINNITPLTGLADLFHF